MITGQYGRCQLRFVSVAKFVEAHDGDVRKGTTIPYISHPLGVASIVLEYGGDEDQAIAALLHDAIEDGGIKCADMIEGAFGGRVPSSMRKVQHSVCTSRDQESFSLSKFSTRAFIFLT